MINIFINDLFMFTTQCDTCNYADDNSLYAINHDFDLVKSKLTEDFHTFTTWFYENYMVLNEDKCYFMALGKGLENENFKFGSTNLKGMEEQKLLGLIIDRNLTFDNHIKTICKMAGQKLNALARISPCIDSNFRQILLNAFIRSQFSYSQLSWMFCSRTSNNRINRIYERCLRLIHNNYIDCYQDLLSIANDVTIHVRNLQTLMIEVFKYLKGLSPPIMNDIFSIRSETYQLRNARVFSTHNPRTVRYGTETISIKAAQLWQLLPDYLKQNKSLSSFKAGIRSCKFEFCPCRLCKVYIQNLGFIS